LLYYAAYAYAAAEAAITLRAFAAAAAAMLVVDMLLCRAPLFDAAICFSMLIFTPYAIARFAYAPRCRRCRDADALLPCCFFAAYAAAAVMPPFLITFTRMSMLFRRCRFRFSAVVFHVFLRLRYYRLLVIFDALCLHAAMFRHDDTPLTLRHA